MRVLLPAFRRVCRRSFQSGSRVAGNELRQAAALVPVETWASSPVFGLDGDKVSPIATPRDFCAALKAGIRGARKRVVLSSLYIGSEQHELIQTLRDSLAENPSLEVQILIDALRGTRAKGGESSVSLLRPLAKEFPRRASVALYHTPALGPALKAALPDRFREAFGLQHMKIYLFDDDLILSGANLNTDYFENRQDRYMRFEGCAGLADFYSDLVHTVASFSYGLGVAELEPKGPDPSRSPAEFKSHAARQLDALKRKWMDSSAALRENLKEGGQHTPPGDTLVVPYVQQGQLGIRDDEAMIEALLAAFAQGMGRGWMVHFTSGYLNFPRRFVDLIMSSESARYAVLTASPMANGWFASKGVSRFIPDAYRLLERNFLQEVEGRGIQGRIEVSEWIKQGWTFHCKGLWAQRADEADPCITLIGSTNYGERSMTRDLESEVLIATMNPALRSKVGEERDAIYRDGELVAYGSIPPPGMFVRVATPVLKKYF